MGRRIRSGTTLSQSQVLADTRATRKLRPVTIRLPMEDIDVARNLAAAKGMGYQTYIRMLLREVLHRKARKQTRS
jgi:predicted DNA binding CopG/RHH family protein